LPKTTRREVIEKYTMMLIVCTPASSLHFGQGAKAGTYLHISSNIKSHCCCGVDDIEDGEVQTKS
jgi:hypothetical protein